MKRKKEETFSQFMLEKINKKNIMCIIAGCLVPIAGTTFIICLYLGYRIQKAHINNKRALAKAIITTIILILAYIITGHTGILFITLYSIGVASIALEYVYLKWK